MNTTNYAYFAAANTANGFHSRFDSLFDAQSGMWNKIYILKGGPGTGKSSFMQRVAAAAEEKGLTVERFYCSSDTHSLDGIRIPARGIAMLDGTAPHTVDPRYPGAVEEIVHLGMFFDAAALQRNAEAIKALCAENGSCHRRAARYLRAAGEMRQISRVLTDGAFLSEKAMAAARRLVRTCKPEGAECQTHEVQLITANSAQGRVHLPTAEDPSYAAHVVYVSDRQKTAAAVLAAILSAAEERGISYVRFADPLLFEETEGVYLPGNGTLYLTDRHGRVRSDAAMLNSARFYDKARLAETRERRRFAKRCEEALLDGADTALADAGHLHDALEQYYIAAMDFKALDAFCKRFLKTVLA